MTEPKASGNQRLSGAVLWLYLKIMSGLYLLFAVVYGGSNYWAAQQATHYHLYWQWERTLPFVPAMIYVYFSIGLLFWLPLWVLDAPHLLRLGKAAALCMLAAGVCFVAWPASTGFVGPELPQDALQAWIFTRLHQFDHPHNTAPSLHIALSTLVLLACASGSLWRKGALLAWWMLIVLAVLLVHQHHVLDVVSGALLGGLGYAWYRGFYRGWPRLPAI
jgi:membrane-associated phospholipid phosphatase